MKGPKKNSGNGPVKNGAAKPKSIMDCYYDLASDNPSQRIKAAASLLEQLIAKESEEDWDYALNRLVKGLSSSHGSARLGFSVALSELLSAREKVIEVSQYLDLADKHFVASGKLTGQEERGLNFGKLFAMKVLAQSPLLLKESTSFADFSRYVDMCLALAVAKPWLRESVFFALTDVLSKHKKFSFDSVEALNYCFKKVEELGLTKTSEGAALYLSCPTENLSLNSSWKNNDPLAKGNLSDLVRALREAPLDNDAKQKGVWKPTLHFIWPILLRELVVEDEEDQGDSSRSHKKRKKGKEQSSKKISKVSERIHLPEFWTAVVDEGMFSATSSPEKKFWGFEIFCLFIQHVSDPTVLFGRNFLRCLVNHFNQADRNLNKEAKKVMSCIQDAVKSKPCSAKIIKMFIKHGEIKMKKAIEQILAVVTTVQLPEIVNTLIKSSESHSWISDLLVSLVKSRRNEEGSARWIEHIVNHFVQLAFFGKASSAELYQSKLNSVLSQAIGVVREDNSTWAYYALERIVSAETSGATLSTEFDEELLKARNKSLKTLQKIRGKRVSSSHTDSSQLESFELLFSLVLLQVHCGDPESMMVLDELQTCYNVIVGKANNEEGGDEPDNAQIDASQVLTEIVVSFASRQSALLRKVSETVFAVFASEMTLESLQLLYDVLLAKENLEGQQQMFEGDGDQEESDEDDEAEEEEQEEENEDSGAELDEPSSPNNDNSEEESSDSDSESEEMDTDEAAEKKANEALAQVLGVNSDEDDDHGSDSDESMDDEQMMALDEQLATIFRERQKAVSKSKGQKIEQANAKQNMIQLKSKIIDLLEVYVKTEPSNSLVLSCIIPLLTVVCNTKDVPLGNKAHELLKTRVCRGKDLPRLSESGISGDDALIILNQIHRQAFKSKNKSHALACNQTSTFITKVLLTQQSEVDYSDQIGQEFGHTLGRWMQSKAKLSPGLFFDLVNYISSRK